MKIENIINNTNIKIYNIKRKLNILSFLKLFLFVYIFYQLYFIIEQYTVVKLFTIISSFLCFAGLFILSTKNTENLIHNENILMVCKEIITEKSGKRPIIISNKNHHYANDLDLFGENSLFEKINRCQTNFGMTKLTFFLLNHLTNSEKIKERQESIKELSKKNEWSVKYLAKAKSINVDDSKLNNISLNKNDFNIINSKKFKICIYLIPILNICILYFFCSSNFSINSILGLAIPISLSFVLNKIYGKSAKKIYLNINLNSGNLSIYSSLFNLIEQENFKSKLNNFNKSQLFNNNKHASYFIKKLSYYVNQFENRCTPIIGNFLDIIFLWNLQFAYRIGKHINENELQIPKWFETISEFEALMCFGIFANQNEKFNYPICSNSDLIFQTDNISHPLLEKNIRISNSFDSKIENNVIIITGANMTGKSTFLRTIGINLVLGMNGCPVSAKKMILKPMELFTSMRTNDSLADGDSYFFSEIKKLRLLINKLENNEPQFILLDEILKGTNSEDKLEGSKLFIEKMINMKATFICCIATHDLELTKMEEKYPNNIKNFCFELNQNNDELLPDYKLKRGVTKTMNAIRLMKQYKIID